jgi:hypothetical protein
VTAHENGSTRSAPELVVVARPEAEVRVGREGVAAAIEGESLTEALSGTNVRLQALFGLTGSSRA